MEGAKQVHIRGERQRTCLRQLYNSEPTDRFLVLLLASRRPTRKIHVRHQPTLGAKTISTTGMYLHTKHIYVSSRLSSPS